MAIFGFGKKKKNKTSFSNIRKYNQLVIEILKIKENLASLSNQQLQDKTLYFKKLLEKGKTLEEILPEAYAVVCEASTRVLKLTPFKCQIYGAIVLHYGDVAEMKTGEGKTLTSTMPAYLNALTGKGVHIVTVNQYLVQRDANEMGELFGWLGISVGYNSNELNSTSKKLAFSLDITYTTHSEIGFDYLRDNMVRNFKDKKIRSLNYAIVDECDSILIDDARTPLIISGGDKDKQNLYEVANRFVKLLFPSDYKINKETKSVFLTTEGAKKAEKGFRISNLFDVEHTILLHHIQQSLNAHFIIKKGIDYIVSEGKIALIDQNTGRILKGRTYSDGLHQAIEMKEELVISRESKVIATITYQNFFRLYNKLAGMTGTAKTEEEEFLDVYNMHVESIPTNEPIIRIDADDFIFGNQRKMFDSIIKEVKKLHQKKQPILLGTRSVEVSELLSHELQKLDIKHVVLNAKNHTKESEIILGAGKKGAVTIATNMAGRGTDIKLDKDSEKLGGLAVIGCERNESRRIDNQLIGRSGRQGQPGYSRFYISWEDELLVRFAGEKAIAQTKRMGDEIFESSFFTKIIKAAQKRIEGQNFDYRKQLIKYDDVIRKQREVIYRQRDKIILSDDIFPVIKTMYKHVAEVHCKKFIIWFDKEKHVDGEKLNADMINSNLIKENIIDVKKVNEFKYDEALPYIQDIIMEPYLNQRELIGKEQFDVAKKQALLQIIDNNWQQHIDTMTKLRGGIHLRSYSQRNPLQAYIKEGFHLFEDMKSKVSHQIVYALNSFVARSFHEEAHNHE